MEDSGIDSDPKQPSNLEPEKAVVTVSSDSSGSSTTITTPRKSTAKELHRKLERRIEQARKSHRAQEYKKPQSSLIPIQRLPIPSTKIQGGSTREQQPLVQWDTDDSDEDIPVHFFPAAKDRAGRQELSDTFSIEELELSPDEDDLNLVPPKQLYKRCGCCVVPAHWRCEIL